MAKGAFSRAHFEVTRIDVLLTLQLHAWSTLNPVSISTASRI